MQDAVARYRSSSERNDIEGVMATLAPEASLVSPISGRMVFRGQADLRILLSAVYGSIAGLRWTEEVGEGSARVLLGEGRVGPFALSDAMVFDLDEDGRIKRIRPHLRPWIALSFFALVLGPRVARHPGVVWRALRG